MGLLANVDWNPIILGIIGVISISITGWIAIRQSQINSRVELARIEAAKRDRRRSRQLKKLTGETEVQTVLINKTGEELTAVKKSINGMRERELEAEREKAHLAGKAAGIAETKEIAKEVAIEVAKTVAKDALSPHAEPTQVTVMNSEPMPVEIKEHHE